MNSNTKLQSIRVIFAIIIFGLLSFGCQSGKNSNTNQSVNPPSIVESVYDSLIYEVVDVPPEPIDGLQSIQRKTKMPSAFLNSEYMDATVKIRAAINEKGDVIKMEVAKPFGFGCNEAATNAVLQSKFTPGKLNGKLVKVWITVVLRFKKS